MVSHKFTCQSCSFIYFKDDHNFVTISHSVALKETLMFIIRLIRDI